ncbi:unnamed protein product [Effrenium voratum]|uniref:R3H domain-containing protein n=1 Tax=Effrenium voratum TaxID=2562239 RepID=A0AA36N346_9DINO|nr:unnamed protein product [Effrenium voratum]
MRPADAPISVSAAVEAPRLGFVAFAEQLVEKCGSLARAFAYFDYNRTGKVTRSRWDSALSTLHIDLQELCGLPSKQVFKMIDCLNGRAKGEVRLDEWNQFFQKQLQAPGAHSAPQQMPAAQRKWLPERECGIQRRRRWERGARRGALQGVGCRCSGGDSACFGWSWLASDVQEAFEGADGSDVQEAFEGDRSREVPQSFEAPEVLDVRPEEVRSEPTARLEAALPSPEVPEGQSDGKTQGEGEVISEKEDGTADAGQVARPDVPDAKGASEEHPSEATQPDETGDQSGRRSSVPTTAEESGSPETAHDEDVASDSGEEGNLLGDEEELLKPRTTTRTFLEESGQVSEALQQALRSVGALGAFGAGGGADGGDGGGVELSELTEEELHAVALHEELHSDLKQLDLAGKDALAYLLIARFGSLKRAFKWFDGNRSGKVSRVVWDSGIVMLHIDLEQLTGFKRSEVFHIMDRDPESGYISWKKWTKKFFSALNEEDMAKYMQEKAEEKGTLAQRARVKTIELTTKAKKATRRRRGSGPRKKLSLTGDGQSMRKREEEDWDDEFLVRHDQQEDDFRQRALENLQELVRGEAMSYADERFVKVSEDDAAVEGGEGPEEFPDLTPEEKCKLVEEVADELGLWRLPRVAAPKTLKRSATTALAASGSETVLVCHLHNFVAETDAQLQQLQGTCGSLEFPPSLTQIQRVVVHALAADRGLTTVSEGSGPARRLVAYDTGDFVRDLARMLEDLKPGQSKVLPDKLSPAQRRLVHTMAMEIGLTVRSQGVSGLEVANLKEFRSGIESQLMKLAPGEVRTFPSTLSDQESGRWWRKQPCTWASQLIPKEGGPPDTSVWGT